MGYNVCMRDLSVLDCACGRYLGREGIKLKGTLVSGTNTFHPCSSGIPNFFSWAYGFNIAHTT